MRCLGWKEWTVLAVIAVVLAALLVPDAEWASSGTLRMPVRVVVFDAETAAPIAGATVALVRAPPPTAEFELTEYRDRFSWTWLAVDRGEILTRTLTDGCVTIPTAFTTGASHRNPESRAHTRWQWVLVAADGYGRVAIPLRYESMKSNELRREGTLTTAVGLAREKATSK